MAFVLLVWLVFLIVAFAITRWLWPQDHAGRQRAPYALALYLVGCLVVVPLDRWYDERFRQLEKIPSRRAVSTGKR